MSREVKAFGSPCLVIVTSQHVQPRFSAWTVGRSDARAVQVSSKTVVIIDL